MRSLLRLVKKDLIAFVWLALSAPLFLTLYYPIIIGGYDNKRILQISLVVFSHFLLFSSPIYLVYKSYFTEAPLYVKLSGIVVSLFGLIAVMLSEHILYALLEYLHYLLMFNSVLLIASLFSFAPIVRCYVLVAMGISFLLASKKKKGKGKKTN